MSTPPPAPPSDDVPIKTLKHKAFGSAIWTFVRLGTDQLFNFILFALLARMLGPTAFGVFALAYLYAEVGKIITTAGLMDALIREPRITDRIRDSVFWANIGFATILALAGLVLADPIARVLDVPAVAPLIKVLGFMLPISAAGASHMSLRLREFGHKTVALRSIISGVVGGGAALLAAYLGWGVWAFVVQRFVFEVVGTILAWRAYPWIPGRQFSAHQLKALFAFSSNMLITQLLFMLLIRVQDVIVGKVIGSAAVGIYRTAWKMTEVIAQGTIQPFSTVALPTLSRLQHDPAGFDVAYRRLISTAAIFSLPALTGFGLVAGDAIVLLFGPQWTASVDVARVIAAMALPFTIGFFTSPALAALGRSGTISKLALVQVILTVSLSLLAAPHGLVAVAGAYVVRAYLTTPLQMYALQRVQGVSMLKTFKSIAPPFLASLVMGAAVLLMQMTLRDRIGSPLLALAVMVGTAALVYALALLAFGGAQMRGQIGQIKGFLRRRPATT